MLQGHGMKRGVMPQQPRAVTDRSPDLKRAPSCGCSSEVLKVICLQQQCIARLVWLVQPGLLRGRGLFRQLTQSKPCSPAQVRVPSEVAPSCLGPSKLGGGGWRPTDGWAGSGQVACGGVRSGQHKQCIFSRAGATTPPNQPSSQTTIRPPSRPGRESV